MNHNHINLIFHVICCSEIDNGELWHSSVISKRIDSHVVETASGSHYLLFGNFDATRAREQGLLVFAVILINFSSLFV